MFRRSLIALIEGALLAVIFSAILGWIAHGLPFGVLNELPQEIVTRTRPTPFDLGIALAGGAAAAYALAHPRLSAALPGVAIATAIMPPLCTMGIGIALANTSVALGAGLLFITNLASISFAGILVFAALGFRPDSSRKYLAPYSSKFIYICYFYAINRYPVGNPDPTPCRSGTYLAGSAISRSVRTFHSS